VARPRPVSRIGLIQDGMAQADGKGTTGREWRHDPVLRRSNPTCVRVGVAGNGHARTDEEALILAQTANPNDGRVGKWPRERTLRTLLERRSKCGTRTPSATTNALQRFVVAACSPWMTVGSERGKPDRGTATTARTDREEVRDRDAVAGGTEKEREATRNLLRDPRSRSRREPSCWVRSGTAEGNSVRASRTQCRLHRRVEALRA